MAPPPLMWLCALAVASDADALGALRRHGGPPLAVVRCALREADAARRALRAAQLVRRGGSAARPEGILSALRALSDPRRAEPVTALSLDYTPQLRLSCLPAVVSLERLSSLSLRGCRLVGDAFIKRAVRALRPRLQSLDVSDTAATHDKLVKYLTEAHMPALEKLGAAHLNVGDVHVQVGSQSADWKGPELDALPLVDLMQVW